MAKLSGHDHWLAELRWLLIAALATALAFVGAGQAWGQGNSSHGFAKGQILVAKKKTSSRAEFDAEVNGQGGRSVATLANLDIDVVKVPPGKEHDVVERLKGNKHVDFAEVDQEMEPASLVNDPQYSSEWHLSRIGAPAAWDYTLGYGVTIAILDTGVDGTHPDLAPNMVAGWNFYDGNSNTVDVNGHGTAVAGAAAAAANNGIGVAGVAGGAKIMPLRIADANAYTLWSIAAQAINYAADHGSRVVNMSYVGASGSSTIQAAASYLRSKGGVLFVAAGNTGAQDTTAPQSVMQVVSATDENDQLASFSSYGNFVTISAPGNNVLSTKAGGGYWWCWGTSLAAPVAAGTAALIIAKRPDFTSAQVDATLTASATDLGSPGKDMYFGAGRVNAGAAVSLAAGSTPSDTTPPSVAIASPTGGTVSGSVAVSVNASDNVGVTRVDLKVNGTTIATDTSAPYTFTWITNSLANGAASLTATAYDAAGNSATSTAVNVNVANGDSTPPNVAITSPAGGATITGSVTVAANATDNVGVTRVDFRIDGTTVATTNAAPYQFTWTSTQYPGGARTLTAVAYDAAGNQSTSAPVVVTVYNPPSGDGVPPQVSFVSPLGGNVNATVAVTINATDNVGVTRVDLKVNGAAFATKTAAPYTFNWDTSAYADGATTLTAVAYDAAGNSASSSVTVNIAHAPSGGGDTIAPVITIRNPVNGTVVTGMVQVSASATDNAGTGALKLTVFVDGAQKASATGGTVSYAWNAKKASPGVHTITVTALDQAGNISSRQVQVTRK